MLQELRTLSKPHHIRHVSCHECPMTVSTWCSKSLEQGQNLNKLLSCVSEMVTSLSQINEPIPGMFVLIWMHFSLWFQIWSWNSTILNFFTNIVTFSTCRLSALACRVENIGVHFLVPFCPFFQQGHHIHERRVSLSLLKCFLFYLFFFYTHHHQSTAYMMKDEPYIVRRGMSLFLDTLDDETMFKTLSVKDFLWGYKEPFFEFINKYFPQPGVTDEFGFLLGVRSVTIGPVPLDKIWYTFDTIQNVSKLCQIKNASNLTQNGTIWYIYKIVSNQIWYT